MRRENKGTNPPHLNEGGVDLEAYPAAFKNILLCQISTESKKMATSMDSPKAHFKIRRNISMIEGREGERKTMNPATNEVSDNV
eukprot:scaffold31886_cov66-Attheya_sp.AAC.8